jgi:hypothetical protein
MREGSAAVTTEECRRMSGCRRSGLWCKQSLLGEVRCSTRRTSWLTWDAMQVVTFRVYIVFCLHELPL